LTSFITGVLSRRVEVHGIRTAIIGTVTSRVQCCQSSHALSECSCTDIHDLTGEGWSAVWSIPLPSEYAKGGWGGNVPLFYFLYHLFRTGNGSLPGASDTTARQQTNTYITYISIHISNKIISLKKQIIHKATKKLRPYYRQ
jgi:hypothetical protein